MRKIVNQFVKQIQLLGAPEFYISATNKFNKEDYTRKFSTNIGSHEYEVSLVKKWIMEQSGSTKTVGIGVDRYGCIDSINNVGYTLYSHNGYMYLNITKIKSKEI